MRAPELLTIAQAWHEWGCPVLPVIFRPKKNGEGTDKIPLVEYAHWKNGAPQTAEDVRAMPWDRAEGAAILLWPTSDRIIVDLDGAGADRLLTEVGVNMPPTGIVRTRSGGCHYHFRVRPETPPPNPCTADRDKRVIRLLHAMDANGKPCKPAVDLLLNGIAVVAGPGYREDPDHPVEPANLAEIPESILTLARAKSGAARETALPVPDGAGEYANLLRGVPLGMQHDSSVKLIGHLLPKLGRGETWAIMEDWCNRRTPPADKGKVRDNFEDILRKETAKGHGGETAPVLVRLADVRPEAVTWLWQARIARGKLTLFIGDPGQGKSFLTLDLAARITTGTPWPDGTPAPRGDVVLLTAEDGLADTVRPRLDAMGGDPSRVHVLKAIQEAEGERSFDLTRDSEQLEAVITSTRAVLAVIDPVSAYLGKTDSYRDAEVRGVLAPVAALAERTGSAVVGIMHLTKNQQRQAIHRAQGNIAFVGAARAVFAVAEDLEDPERRLFLPVKMNVARKPPGLAFRLVEVGEAARVDWESDPVEVDVEAVLAGPGPPAERSEREGAMDFLREVLAGGPVAANEVKQQAKAADISGRTLFRAKKELGVKAEKTGFDGGWRWHLPPKAATSPPSGRVGNLGSLRSPEGAPAEVEAWEL